MTLAGSVCRQKALVTSLRTSNTDGATWEGRLRFDHFVAAISDSKQYRNVRFTSLKEYQWERDSECKYTNITLINSHKRASTAEHQ